MILLIVLFVLIWFLLFVFKPGSKPKMGPNLGPFLFSFAQASSSQARAQQLQGRTHQETKKLGPKKSQPHRAQRPANEAAAAFPFLPRPELHGPPNSKHHQLLRAWPSSWFSSPARQPTNSREPCMVTLMHTSKRAMLPSCSSSASHQRPRLADPRAHLHVCMPPA